VARTATGEEEAGSADFSTTGWDGKGLFHNVWWLLYGAPARLQGKFFFRI